MASVSWLERAMEKDGYTGRSATRRLAEDSGVSYATIRNMISKGTSRMSTAEKVQAVLSTPIGPDVKVVTPEMLAEGTYENSVLYLPVAKVGQSIARFKGKECAVTSALCMSCWNLLADQNLNLPVTRAACKLEHGWMKDPEKPGTIVFEGLGHGKLRLQGLLKESD